MDPTQSQLNAVYILTYYVLKIRFNIILTSISRSSKSLFPFRCAHYNSVSISHIFHAFYMPCESLTFLKLHFNLLVLFMEPKDGNCSISMMNLIYFHISPENMKYEG
jgi:hypothetical protein